MERSLFVLADFYLLKKVNTPRKCSHKKTANHSTNVQHLIDADLVEQTHHIGYDTVFL